MPSTVSLSSHPARSARRAAPAGEIYRARWPERLIELGRCWKDRGTSAQRDAVLGEMWLLIHGALLRYVRVHRPLAAEEAVDIVADKAADLLLRLERGSWDPSVSSPAQVCAFLAAIARNGVVDHLRAHRWEGDDPGVLEAPHHETPASSFERLRFVETLRECAGRLAPRARMVWFFRVFYDMSSREIAVHREVRMTAAAVDMAFSRSRARITACMKSKGLQPGDMPPGTFTALWDAFRRGGR
ncbi:MAG: sigma-70 family RNA polymerase sigma factor [Candidatus Polarisedimenticolia bacterium]